MPSPHAPANGEPDAVSAGTSHRLDDPVLHQGGGVVPLIDEQALRELEEDFDDPAVADDFARDFAHSWEGKYQRLAASVQQRNQERAKEAVLSVKVTSIMVGASRLAQLAARFEQFVDDNDMDAAAHALAGMEGCGLITRAELLKACLP